MTSHDHTRGRRQCDITSGCGSFYTAHSNVCPSCGASEAFSSFIPFNPSDWVYDIECYPNIFTAAFRHVNTGVRTFFEISEWQNDVVPLIEFLHALKTTSCRLIGYYNVGYDYPLLHFIIENYNEELMYEDIYTESSRIISTPWSNRFDNVVWGSDVHIHQIDLFKIHHFDNKSRRTSLKMLEFNMRMDSVEDLPFKPGSILNYSESRQLIEYNWHDVDATELFYFQSLPMIEFREHLSTKHNRNFLNHSDKKIGTDLFVAALEENEPGSCYTMEGGRYVKVNGRKKLRQTIRHQIVLSDIIFPYINFKEPEFQRVKDWLMRQTIINFDDEYLNIKGIFKDLTANVDGLKYKFGSGGIHASVESSIICSDDDYVIVDWDVGGYYPEVGGANKMYPSHLSGQFCVVNESLKQERKQYKKGTPLNLSIKLSRNGAYGDSNNKYSPLYDPQYTMAITINGQLLLCLLAQYLNDIPDLQIIQVNTDGMTVKCPRTSVKRMNSICAWWEKYTCLELESVIYNRMFIRDVNNYIGEYEGGGVKRKGVYAHETPLENCDTQEVLWHKNHSALVVPKAAEAALLHGRCIRDFITNHDDIYDFMLRTKVGNSDRLELDQHKGFGVIGLQRITRYYVSCSGGTLTKISPPANGVKVGVWKRANKLTDTYYNSVIEELNRPTNHSHFDDLDTNGLRWDARINTKNRSKYEIRETSINSGWLVTPCNNIDTANRDDINFEYYIHESEKLVMPLRG